MNWNGIGGESLDNRKIFWIASEFGKLLWMATKSMLIRLQVLFVPYALHDRDHYADVARSAFVEMGFELESIHQTGSSAKQAVKDAQSIFIGGGNTFRLLKALYDNDLVGKKKYFT